MVKSFKISISVLLSVIVVFSASSCAVKTSDVSSSTETTSPDKKVSISTNGNVVDDKYSYVLIKQKTNTITSDFDKIISDKKYNGTTYYKIGNDFEYFNTSGMENITEHKSNSVNTRYFTGSITKQFTSAAIMMLCEQGKLSLSDDLTKFYPSYKYAYKITVRNLLNMTAGLKNYVVRYNTSDTNIYLCSELEDKISEKNTSKQNKKVILDWILNQDLQASPDTEFYYSDSNYYLLGDIIEKVSGISYEKFMKENIFNPVAMGSTNFVFDDKIAVSIGLNDAEEKLLYNGVGYSSLGMISSVSDILKWIDAFLGEEIVSKESIDLMFTPYKNNYALGFYVSGSKVCQYGVYGSYSTVLNYKKDKSEIFISFTNDKNSEPVYIYSLFKKYLKKYQA